MTSTTDTPEPTDSHRADDRTHLLSVEEGVLLYDVENPTGWIQSDVSADLAARR